MNKTWIFFKLRMLQLRYDKTALFFSYLLPVLLLTGIGYPVEMMNKAEIPLAYIDNLDTDHSREFVSKLAADEMVEMISLSHPDKALAEVKDSKRDHLLIIDSRSTAQPEGTEHTLHNNQLKLSLFANDQADSRIESKALASIIEEHIAGHEVAVDQTTLKSGSVSSYISTLLPGLMGMTLLIIGLNGFGGVLIEEAHEGLFKNIKTIDASPIPFLSGLLLSRLLVSYTVAAALFVIGVTMFNLNHRVDVALMLFMLTLGCIAFLGIGLVIAVLSPSVNSFNGIVNFVEIPFLVFSGVFFSITAFPEWLQYVAKAIPLTHMNNALHAIIFEGVGMLQIHQLSTEIAVLGMWCLGTLLLGWYKFKW